MPIADPGADGSGADRRLRVRVTFGLANRLMGLASAVVLARAFQRKLTVLWSTADGCCVAPLEALFDLREFTDFEVIDPRDSDPSAVDVRTIPSGKLRDWLQGPEVVVSFRGCEFFGADTLPPHVFYSAIQDVMRRIHPSAQVRALLGDAPRAAVGIHARFTDHLPCWAMTPRWCYRALAVQLNQSVPTAKVLVCSDRPDLARELVSILGSRGVLPASLRQGDRIDRTSLLGVQLAAADLWQLAQAHCIFASPISSFAVSASALGGGVRSTLFASQHVTRMKARALLWRAASHLKYESSTETWSLRESTAGGFQTLAERGTAQAFMRLVTSSIYQDHPRADQETRCRARVAEFLCENAHVLTPEADESAPPLLATI